MEGILKEIALANGVTEKEVREEIEKAIKEAFENRSASPEASALWDRLSEDGKLPDAEKFIRFCVDEISAN